MYRLTFSKSLADLICERSNGLYKVRRFDCVLGRPLNTTEQSVTGVYVVVSTLNGIVLRAPLFQEMANMYRDSSREIREAFLIPL